MGGTFSARVPRSSAEVRRVFNHDLKEVEDVGQQEQQGDKRDKEGDEVKGEVEEIRSNAHSAHEDDYGMNGDSNLSHSVRFSEQGRQSRDDDTN